MALPENELKPFTAHARNVMLRRKMLFCCCFYSPFLAPTWLYLANLATEEENILRQSYICNFPSNTETKWSAGGALN